MTQKHAQEIEDRKQQMMIMQREIDSLKHTLENKGLDSKALQDEIASQSSKVISIENMKNKLEEAEEDKKRTEARLSRSLDTANDENKALRQEL